MRTFIAVKIPEEIKKKIIEIQNKLPEFVGKKIEEENLHFKLRSFVFSNLPELTLCKDLYFSLYLYSFKWGLFLS